MLMLMTAGWRALGQDLIPVLAVLACLIWGSITMVAVIRRLAGQGWQPDDAVTLASGGWVVALALVAIPLFLLGALLGLRPDLPTAGLAAILVAGALVMLPRGGRTLSIHGAGLPAAGLILLFLFNALIRLAFVTGTALPLYFDSAEHYRIVEVLIGEYRQASAASGVTWPTPGYYHLGFHLMMAVLVAVTGQNLAQTMLVAGQIVLAALPIGLFMLPKHETGSTGAGFAAVIFAMAGWYMPAHAVNWGKYPALFSLPAILFCLNVAYLAGRSEPGERVRLIALTVLAAGLAAVIHTRAIILLGMGWAAWWLAGHWSSRPVTQRWLLLAPVLMILTAQSAVIFSDPALSGVLDPYVHSGLPVTVWAGLAALVGLWKYPRLTCACLLSIVLIMLGLFIPVPGFGTSPLLDRPLVEMVLFVPLALISALGVAATAERLAFTPGALRTAGAALLCTAIVVHAVDSYSFYPSTCCVLVQSDDLVALDWIEKNVADNARIAIPTAALRAAPSPYTPLSAAADAGAWITPLTSRQTTGLPNSIDFRQPSTLDQLCRAGISYLYVSWTSQSFNRSYVEAKAGWYRPELSLPKAGIYRLTGCAT